MQTHASGPLIEIVGLRKAYGQNVALDDINLEVARGEFLVILGRSGAGKSTLMGCINRLVQPTSGQIVFDGRSVENGRGQLRPLRRGIGMIFQQFNLVKRLTVITNVMTGGLGTKGLLTSLVGYFNRDEKLRALECLDRVNMAHKAFQRADTLSGGEQQRVAIARALYQNPMLLLADEPVASLDPAIARTVLAYLVNYAREFGRRVVGLAGGVVAFDGDVAALDDAILNRIYGGKPEDTYGD